MVTIDDCKLISVQSNSIEGGTLSSVLSSEDVPFEIKRTYYTYDIPADSIRGGHAHKEQSEFVIAATGSFEVVVTDYQLRKKRVFLNNPKEGLLLPPGIWRELVSFSSGSVVLVMASDIYDQEDYIMEFDQYKKWKND